MRLGAITPACTLLAGLLLGLTLGAGPALPQDNRASGSARFVQVAAGESHTCALTSEGVTYCWGSNSFGELGAVTHSLCKEGKGSTACSAQPVAVQGGQRFVSLAAGRLHTCGLTADGAAYCWGDNTIGQLGVHPAPDRCGTEAEALPCSRVPVRVDSARRFTALVAGRYHTCGLGTDGEVLCWGSNKMGQLGTMGSFDNCAEALPGEPTWACLRRPTGVAGNLRFSSIGAGDSHTCGLAADSTAYCWGKDYRSVPAPVPAKDRFSSISAGGGAACALSGDGRPFCWGLLFLVGDKMIGVREPSVEGGAEKSGLRFTRLAVGQLHYCGLTADGKVYCWGRGDEGQLGVKRGLGAMLTKSKFNPQAALVEGVPAFVALAAGAAHTCAVATDGVVYCWGLNVMGQLGDGTVQNRQTPTAVAPVAQEQPRT